MRAPATAALGIGGRVTSGTTPVPDTPVRAVGSPATHASALAIPDQGTVTSTFEVLRTEIISEVQVNVDIGHSFRGDLEITLIHSDGTEVILKTPDIGDDGQDDTTSFSSLTAPLGDLDTLAGKPAGGVWSLRIRDAFSGDTGEPPELEFDVHPQHQN